MDRSFKRIIHDHCRQVVAARLDALAQALRELSESVANETKSSAGDKYETARAMLHIEQDGIRRQQAAAAAQRAVLDALDPSVPASRIAPGSLAHIGGTWYYVSIGLGKMQVAGQPVIALSLQAPLGARLKGLAAGDPVLLNGTTCRVDAVL